MLRVGSTGENVFKEDKEKDADREPFEFRELVGEIDFVRLILTEAITGVRVA